MDYLRFYRNKLSYIPLTSLSSLDSVSLFIQCVSLVTSFGAVGIEPMALCMLGKGITS